MGLLKALRGDVPGGQNRLQLNDGFGRFTDVTAARMPLDNDYSRAVALGDVDGDDDLDLVFGNNAQNRLYLNDGTDGGSDRIGRNVTLERNLNRWRSLNTLLLENSH